MTTQQVADKFYEYMQQGAFDKIYAELFSPDATSEETPGSDWTKATGMKEIHEKGKKWNDMIEAMHGGTTGKPVVAGDYFTSFMTMDFTPKGGPRTNMEEIGLYKVKDGKIVSEQFFY
ncbi:MAG: nuclear transport factor 2 family protein [Chitinophagaceae bacterium]|nr:nuclear transport factor 2 family protein [Chitinophagaceae bacterium]